MVKRIEEKSFFAKHKIGIIVGVVVLILASFLISSYNKFIVLDQNIDSKWSEVENQYQRQADLIENLISVVTSAVSVETDFVKEVTAARTGWQNANSVAEKEQAGVEMNSEVAMFMNAVAENYPTLQANTNYVQLIDEIAGTQNRITTARGRYIESIQIYNTAIMRFPANILANIYGFDGREYYTAEEGSLDTPELGDGVLP